jgi:hypothetical protein
MRELLGVVEKLLIYADYRDVDNEVSAILPLVNEALANLGNTDRMRTDLEDIRAAAVRAILKLRSLDVSAANDDA